MGAGIAGMKATKVGRNAGHSSAGLGTGGWQWFPAGHDMQKPQPLVGAAGKLCCTERKKSFYLNYEP